MESKYQRIAIVGASSVGKTTLAKHLSNTFKLYYVDSSSSVLWEQFGFYSHEDVHVSAYENPKKLWDLQEKIYELRMAHYQFKSSFITDRSPIDQCAYFLNYFQLSNPLDKFSFINKLSHQCKYIDAFIYIKFVNEQIDPGNGKRIVDPLYQLQIDALMNMVIEKDLLKVSNKPIIILDKWDLDYRLEKVINFLAK